MLPPYITSADTAKRRKMLDVLEQFRILFKAVRHHYAEIQRQVGIGGVQLWALSHIANNPDVKPGELARGMAIHASTASNLVRDLERLKLVTRRRQRKDHRVVVLNATDKGLEVLQKAPQPFVGVLQQALSDLPTANLEMLHIHVGKVLTKIKVKDAKARSTPLSKIL